LIYFCPSRTEIARFQTQSASRILFFFHKGVREVSSKKKEQIPVIPVMRAMTNIENHKDNIIMEQDVIFIARLHAHRWALLLS
jgi:hypothetical protein